MAQTLVAPGRVRCIAVRRVRRKDAMRMPMLVQIAWQMAIVMMATTVPIMFVMPELVSIPITQLAVMTQYSVTVQTPVVVVAAQDTQEIHVVLQYLFVMRVQICATSAWWTAIATTECSVTE